MKKPFVVLGALLLVAGLAQAQTIAGSAHDFSGAAWNSGGDICIVCHAPHNPSPGGSSGPLWNHAATAVTDYDVYGGGGAGTGLTLRLTPVAQPGAKSKVCLSCHDGTVALDSFGGATGTSFIAGDANVGTDLQNDHPVGVQYLPANDLNVLGSPIGGRTIDATATGVLAAGNVVECTSCHEVHNDVPPTTPSLLHTSNTGSLLCLACHKK